MEVYIIGVDIAKRKFDVALLLGERSLHRTFPNSAQGFACLKRWLEGRGIVALRACMEATGRYWEALAIYLYEAGYTVSVVNPRCVKAFAESELRRTKTDRVDAAVIARFCRANSPRSWTPPEPELRELQQLVRRLEALKGIWAQENNRLSSPGISPAVETSLQEVLAYLQTQIKAMERQIREHFNNHPQLQRQQDLLTSIPAVGEKTAALLLAELGNIHNYTSVRQVGAHAGLTPQHRESGSSIQGKPRLSKVGNVRLRKPLFMPAIVAKTHNPLIKPFYHRLLTQGKPPMVATAASMRKLLHIAFGVLKHNKPFDPNHQPSFA